MSPSSIARRWTRRIAVDPGSLQGTYYVVTGLWPIVHLRSFVVVTGPKRDTWLVQTFGALVAALGVSLIGGRRRYDGMLFAVASALALATCEVFFVAKGRIRPVYAADAAIELALAAAALVDPLRRQLRDRDVRAWQHGRPAGARWRDRARCSLGDSARDRAARRRLQPSAGS